MENEKGYLKIGSEHVELESIYLINSHFRLRNKQVIQPPQLCCMQGEIKTEQTILINVYIFNGIDKILVEEPFIQAHDIITEVKARRKVHYISILISNPSGQHVKLPRIMTSGHLRITDSLQTITLTMAKLIEKEINQIVEKNHIKFSTEFLLNQL